MRVRFCDEFEGGLGWIAAEPAFMERCSHALAAEGRVWLVDALDGEGIEERVRSLGEPAGVIQTLSRHGRDSAELAQRLGVPRYVVPFEGVPGAPFEPIPILRSRLWTEAALWWPERRALVVGDALGTAFYFRAGDEPLAVHPLLRLTPPGSLGRLRPEHILVGHGEGVHGPEAAATLDEALATARRRLPRQLLSSAQGWARRLRPAR